MQTKSRAIIYITVGSLFIYSILNELLHTDSGLYEPTYFLWPVTLLAVSFVIIGVVELFRNTSVVKTASLDNPKRGGLWFSPLVIVPVILLFAFVYIMIYRPDGFGGIVIIAMGGIASVVYVSIYLSIKLYSSGTEIRNLVFILFVIVTVLYSIGLVVDNMRLESIAQANKARSEEYKEKLEKIKAMPLGSDSSAWDILNGYTNGLGYDDVTTYATVDLFRFSHYEFFTALSKCGEPVILGGMDLSFIYLDDKLIYKYISEQGVSEYDENIITIDTDKEQITICGQAYPTSFFSSILNIRGGLLEIQFFVNENTTSLLSEADKSTELYKRFQEYSAKRQEDYKQELEERNRQ